MDLMQDRSQGYWYSQKDISYSLMFYFGNRDIESFFNSIHSTVMIDFNHWTIMSEGMRLRRNRIQSPNRNNNDYTIDNITFGEWGLEEYSNWNKYPERVISLIRAFTNTKKGNSTKDPLVILIESYRG